MPRSAITGGMLSSGLLPTGSAKPFFVYATSLPQLLLIVIMLGFTGKDRMLHHFLHGVPALSPASFFGYFFQLTARKAYLDLPQWVTETIPMAVDPAYGQELMRLGQEGVSYLTPKNVLGLIGFPSFHIFMAAMSVRFVPRHWLVMAVILLPTRCCLPFSFRADIISLEAL